MIYLHLLYLLFNLVSDRITVIVLKIFPASHKLTRKKSVEKSLKITISFGCESPKFLLTAML